MTSTPSILITGGGGAVARAAGIALARMEGIGRVLFADISEDRAKASAAAVGSLGAAAHLDVLDRPALDAAVQQSSLVLNCAGPFFKLGVPVLESAIEAGRPYIDICDDPQPTLDMLALSEPAAAKGVTAVVGMGASPGVTNLLAKLAGETLEQVDEIITGWNLEGDLTAETVKELHAGDDVSLAALIHWMKQISGRIPAWREGKLGQVQPLEAVRVSFPGIGTRRTWTVGHPEAVTLARSFPNIRDSVNVMVLPMVFAEVLIDLAHKIDAGRMSVEDAAREVAKEMTAVPPFFRGLIIKALRFFDRPVFPQVFAVVEGRKGEHYVRVGARLKAWPKGGMDEATGIPLAIAAKLLLEGSIDKPGVHAPEDAITPDAFFQRFQAYCDLPRGARSVDKARKLARLRKGSAPDFVSLSTHKQKGPFDKIKFDKD